MAKNLLIVESPGKIQKLQSILGTNWMVAASVGHIRDLPEDRLGVNSALQPEYLLTTRGKEVARKLQALVAQADQVYLATDPDREGEAISWHLQQVLKPARYRRMTFSEITADAVNAALKKPRDIDLDLVRAQEARRVLDRLVGFQVSPVASRSLGQSVSAGRVQSVALRLVVDQEQAIRKFVSVEHYSAQLQFDQGTAAWTADWKLAPGFVSDQNPYFMDKGFAGAVAALRKVKVLSSKDGTSRRSPPAPFTTSTLQQAASIVLKFDPKKTMQLAQKLYEQGFITYHRTDSPNLSAEAFREIAAYAAAHRLPVVTSQRHWKAKAGAQEAHEACRPTHIADKVCGSTSDEEALYRLIRVRALASQLADAEYTTRNVLLEALDPVQGKTIQFEGKGKTLVKAGWLVATQKDQTDESDAEPDNPIPALTPGTVLNATTGRMLVKKTKPPVRYTQASLIKKLESEEIGRPSTYATIMDTLIKRQYVTVTKQFLYATPLGESLCGVLVDRFSFMELPFTRDMEQQLDQIAEGKSTYQAVVSAANRVLLTELSALAATAPKGQTCPACQQAALFAAKSSKGTSYWRCDSCKAAFADQAGKPGDRFGDRTPVPLDKTAPLCPACKKHHLVQATSKQGNPYWRCTGYPKCSAAFADVAGKPGNAFGDKSSTKPAAKRARPATSKAKAPAKKRAKAGANDLL